MLRRRDLPVALRVNVASGGIEGEVGVGLHVKEPEGDVNALDLLNVVLVAERLRQQSFFP